jgi:hypothetical protein
MSYEDTACPCGGKKERETLICAECQKAFAHTFEFKRVYDLTEESQCRRTAAIKLLAMARRRNKRLPLVFIA